MQQTKFSRLLRRLLQQKDLRHLAPAAGAAAAWGLRPRQRQLAAGSRRGWDVELERLQDARLRGVDLELVVRDQADLVIEALAAVNDPDAVCHGLVEAGVTKLQRRVEERLGVRPPCSW